MNRIAILAASDRHDIPLKHFQRTYADIANVQSVMIAMQGCKTHKNGAVCLV